MRASATTDLPAQTAADTVAIGVFAGEAVAHDADPTHPLQGLLDAGEAKAAFRHLAVAHAGGKRWILVGLGDREGFDAERARLAAAAVQARAKELGTRTLCWEVPHHVSDAVVGGLVEGTLLAAYAFTQFKSSSEPAVLEALVVSAHHDVGAVVARAEVLATAVNAARDLQNTPANHMTPTHLAQRARALDAMDAPLAVDVEGREGLAERGMGAFAAVAQGTDEEPALIVLDYRGAGPGEPVRLGLVGKAVTFDTGGISLKNPAKMHEMKFDMSGGAAVVEAIGAIAALRLPVNLVGVVGATENMPSGRALKPGDVITTKTGTTVEVNNTDAEGRLVLADCLAHAIELGAERLVDVATLTGSAEATFGKTYAALFASDDAWAAEVEQAARAAGELVWRLPLHPDYAERVTGRYADLSNAVEPRTAGAITAAEFLRTFTAGRPWAHLDIAGVANDTGKAYAAKGGSGAAVRLLVALAERVAAAPG